VKKHSWLRPYHVARPLICGNCRGKKWVDGRQCPKCRGTGFTELDKRKR